MSSMLEAGLGPAHRSHEDGEEHQAEASPLIWHENHQRWVTEHEAALLAEQETVQSSPAGKASEEAGSSETVAVKNLKEGRKPLRAFSEGSNGAIYINFEDDDPENPFEWSKRRKWVITGIGKTCFLGGKSFIADSHLGAWLTTLVAICKALCDMHCLAADAAHQPDLDWPAVLRPCSKIWEFRVS